MAPDEFKETQVIALHVHGPGMFHSASKQIKTHADLKGMKVRGPTRQITKLLGSVGATPVGMPLPQIPDALSKGTIDACVIPWEVVPSVKVHELTKFHSEFDSNGPALYTTTFVMAMNKAKYDGLAPDLKKVIDANSGLATSAWLGKVQQGNDPTGRKAAVDRGNTLYTFTGVGAAGVHQAVGGGRRRVGGRHEQAQLRRQEAAGHGQGADRQARQGVRLDVSQCLCTGERLPNRAGMQAGLDEAGREPVPAHWRTPANRAGGGRRVGRAWRENEGRPWAPFFVAR